MHRGAWNPGTPHAELMWPNRHRAQMMYRALGMPWPGGRPRKRSERLLVEIVLAQERVADAVTALTAALPAVPAEREGAAAKLGRVALRGLEVLEAVVNTPIDWDKPRQARIICDMAVAANQLLMRAAESEYRQRREDGLTRLLEMLAENERKAASQ